MGNKQSVKSHIENAQRTGVFQLSNAKLVEVPPDLFRLKTLRSIDLSGNKLRELPPAFGTSFANLRTLLLNGNQLASLPEEICQLAKLEVLSLAGNILTGLPVSFPNLRSLRSVNLSGNHLTTFPVAALSNLRQLDFVDLSKNSIQTVPAGVSAIYASEINLNENQLSSLSDDLADCPRLKVLRVEENCLALGELTRRILPDSGICLLAAEGNLFEMKQLHDAPGHEKYMERYTATKKKM